MTGMPRAALTYTAGAVNIFSPAKRSSYFRSEPIEGRSVYPKVLRIYFKNERISLSEKFEDNSLMLIRSYSLS